MNMKKMSIREFSERLGVTAGTVRKWESNGKIKPVRTTGGHRRYTEDDIIALTGGKKLSGMIGKKRRSVIYCRVSHHDQLDELKRKAEKMEMFALGMGISAEIITEIGDGEDVKRPKFMKLVSSILNGEIETIMLLHKNQLMHQGFELLESISKEYGCQIITAKTQMEG